MYAKRRIVNFKQTQRVTEACANSPPRIRRIPHRESADFLTANSPTSPPRIPYREFADLSLSLANIDQWIRGESMANVRPIICVIGEYHSSRIRRIKFVWIRGEYSPRKFQMNSTVDWRASSSRGGGGQILCVMITDVTDVTAETRRWVNVSWKLVERRCVRWVKYIWNHAR